MRKDPVVESAGAAEPVFERLRAGDETLTSQATYTATLLPPTGIQYQELPSCLPLSKVEDLDLSRASIPHLTIAKILMASHNTVTHVDLSFDEITDPDLTLLAGILINCRHLSHLNLNGNKLTDASADVLKRIARELPELVFLSMEHNDISVQVKHEVQAIIRERRGLVSVLLSAYVPPVQGVAPAPAPAPTPPTHQPGIFASDKLTRWQQLCDEEYRNNERFEQMPEGVFPEEFLKTFVKDYEDVITQELLEAPVKIKDHQEASSLSSLLAIPQDTQGNRNNPFRQGETFKRTDLTPARDVQNAMNSILKYANVPQMQQQL